MVVNVGYLVSTLKRSGPTRQLLNIVSNLDRSEFCPVILTLSAEEDDSLIQEFLGIGIGVSSLSMTRRRGLLGGRSGVTDWIKKQSIKVLHTQGIRADLISASLGLPRVATLRNYPYHDYPMLYGRSKGRLMAKAHFWALARITKVCVVSRGCMKLAMKHNLDCQTVWNGVDSAHFCPSDDKKEVRRKLGLMPDVKIAISTGHIIARKNPELLLSIFSALSDCQLLVLGDGELRESLERKYCAYKNIRFVGRVSDVRPWLQSSDIFVSTSLSEGLPNAVMEAMACGLPCVLSDIPPHRELVSESSLAGVVVPGLNPSEYRIAISSLINSEARSSEAARNAALVDFSAVSMSKNYQHIYAGMVSENK